jgi:dolichyl-phosphate beta-glucosyltransferase
MALTSIILPVYNCTPELKKGLAELKPLLEREGIDHEILIVDDGSADLKAVMDVVDDHNATTVLRQPNMGKGLAVKYGVGVAKGDIIIFMDGDFPFHLSVIPNMIVVLQSGKADVVIGDRTLKDSQYPVNINPWRKMGSKVLSMIVSNFYVPGFRDTQCGVKGFTKMAGKKIFGRVTQPGFSFDVEVLFIAHKNGYTIARVPVQVYEQANTSVRVLKDGRAMLRSLYSIFINNRKGEYKIK